MSGSGTKTGTRSYADAARGPHMDVGDTAVKRLPAGPALRRSIRLAHAGAPSATYTAGHSAGGPHAEVQPPTAWTRSDHPTWGASTAGNQGELYGHCGRDQDALPLM
ncbi:unnamed protein product [Merluccius merluccius]